jgi:2-hydroxy-6-oxonona-2,4-dienedioate hydrolase
LREASWRRSRKQVECQHDGRCMRNMKTDPRTGEPESRWTPVDGVRMHVRVSERPTTEVSPPVILVHGLVVSGRYMLPTLRHLALSCKVYAPDLPGFGRSEKPPRVLDVAALSDALARWMGAVGLGSAALVGNSLGCQIVADLAARHPELVEWIVLQGPTMDPRARSVPQQIARFLLDAPREPSSLLPIQLRDYLAAGPRRAWRTFVYALENRIEDNLPRVEMPALVVRGSRDPICPQRWAEEAAGLLPRGRLVVVPGAAHTLNFAQPAEFADLIREFFEEGREG